MSRSREYIEMVFRHAEVPGQYETANEADPVALVALYGLRSGWTWFVYEYDPETGIGYALVNGMAIEAGAFYLPELLAADDLVVLSDFTPAPIWSIKALLEAGTPYP